MEIHVVRPNIDCFIEISNLYEFDVEYDIEAHVFSGQSGKKLYKCHGTLDKKKFDLFFQKLQKNEITILEILHEYLKIKSYEFILEDSRGVLDVKKDC